MDLWNIETEEQFFRDALKLSSPEQLFYNLSSGYYAYVPKNYSAEGQTLQSRNAFIGSFTEKWAKDLLASIAKAHGLYAVNTVCCETIGLPHANI